jgi:LPS export ABC transporter protein LptC
MQKQLLFFGILALGTLAACSNDIKKVDKLIAQRSQNVEKADSVLLRYSNNGQMRAILSAPSFVHVLDSEPAYVLMNKGIKVSFYNGADAPTSTLTAKRARYFEKTNNVIVRDSVVVVSANKETLATEELIWNDKSQKFFTKKYVTITTADQIIYGDGMEANQDFTTYKILSPKGIIQLDKSKQNW